MWTLQLFWYSRLESNWNKVLIESLQETYPALRDPAEMEVFHRKWKYMFVYMAAGYARRWVNSSIWAFSRSVWSLDMEMITA